MIGRIVLYGMHYLFRSWRLTITTEMCVQSILDHYMVHVSDMALTFKVSLCQTITRFIYFLFKRVTNKLRQNKTPWR